MAEESKAELLGRAGTNLATMADLVEGLDESELATPSLCAGWAVRDVVGHLVMTLDVSAPRFLLGVLRDRGRAARTSDRLARDYGRRPIGDLLAVLRDRQDDQAAPPGIGATGPLADSCIHLRDIAVPLGLPTTAPLDDWRLVLDFLTTPGARRGGFLPAGRLDGLALRATDVTWTHGSGAEVSGPAESLALALTGREAGLPELSGAGVEVLAGRC